MMAVSSTPSNPNYDLGKVNAVSPYVTLGILVAGVAGGLVIVIAFILFCKYCVRKKNTLRRDQGTDCERSSDRRFKPFQRYETINSDVFSEPSTGSMDGIPVSPRRLYEAKSQERITTGEEANETTKLKSDFERTSYRETDLDLEPLQDDQTHVDSFGDASVTGNGGTTSESEQSGRRVSFQLDNLPPTPAGYLHKGRRYTEGDFHYLKKIRISKKNVPRQCSLGVTLRRDSNNVCPPESFELRTIPSSVEEFEDDVKIDINPMKTTSFMQPTLLDSPSPTIENVGPQLVDVEVHYRNLHGVGINNNNRSFLQHRPHANSFSKVTIPTRLVERVKALKPTSYSMDAVSPSDTSTKTNRKTKSYDDVLDYDYDVLKITEFSRGPYYNNDFDPIAEVEALGSGKVRYNDMGSIEVINDEKLYSYDDSEYENIIPDESDADTETTLNGTQKYREIWNLRRTLEEEEECSDTIRMEDMASPDEQSPDVDLGGTSYSPTYHAAATEAAQYQNNNICHPYKNGHLPIHGLAYVDALRSADPENANLLHPNYEQRRDCYNKIISRRYQKRGSTSAENSFDSVETFDTDGDISDTSRQEVTTSFESTTDNTDSTNDSQTSRLRQMKADSGYKSLETQHSVQNGANSKQLSQAKDDEIVVLESSIPSPSTSKENTVLEGVGTHDAVIPRRGSIFEKRKGRTASKRRREYSRDRQAVRLYDSVEPETDSTRSDQPSGDSFEEPNTPSSKFSVFSRFFKSQRYSRNKSLSRDFSIDEKSNELFQEFMRYDPKFDGHRGSVVGLIMNPSENRRHRLQRKFTDPGPCIYYDDGNRHWLSPEMRSTSLGSDSSASSARKISPQDSIEEEEYEDDIDAAVMHHKNRILEEQTTKPAELPTPTVSIHEIPIIKLPEGEIVDG